jgi:hypothetical protein
VHPEFAENLRVARAARIYWRRGVRRQKWCAAECRVVQDKKAWAAKFKEYAVLAGVKEPKKSCHGLARAELAAYAECTESQMMAMFGWTDPKMPAHYIAQANREKLGISGMDNIVAFDQSQNMDDFLPLPDEQSSNE